MADLQKLRDNIFNALDKLVHLQIVTAVAQITVTLKQDGSVDTLAIPGNAKAMSTSIDLLQGDIATVIDPEFVTGPYQNLRAYHADREKEAHQIVQQNLAAVRELAKLVKDAIEGRV